MWRQEGIVRVQPLARLTGSLGYRSPRLCHDPLTVRYQTLVDQRRRWYKTGDSNSSPRRPKMAHPNLTPSESFRSFSQPQPREAHTVDDVSTELEEDVKVYKARCGVIGFSVRENDFWSTLILLNLGGRIKKGLTAPLQLPTGNTLVGAIFKLGARLCLLLMPDDAPPQTCTCSM